MLSLFSKDSSDGEPGYTLEDRHHEAVQKILNKICEHKPERPLCRISTRLFEELQNDKIVARFIEAETEDAFDFLHLYFPIGPFKKAALQLYAWIDGEDMYCIGIGSEDKGEIAIEKLHDHDAYLMGHKLFMELLQEARKSKLE